MNTKYIFSPLVLGFGALLWINASGGVAHIQKKDRTGSPVSDVACTQCHVSTGNFSSVGSLQLLSSSGTVVTHYLPGETYQFKVKMQSARNVGHGFQVTGLLADNSSAGTCLKISSNVQITPLNGRWYFESDGLLSGGEYVMNWTAPSAGSGSVTFYGNGLSTNGNNTTTGEEFVAFPSLTIDEDITSGISRVQDLRIKVYPNPTERILFLESDITLKEVNIFDLKGGLIKSLSVNGLQISVDVSDFPKGIYFVHASTEGKVIKSSFVKK